MTQAEEISQAIATVERQISEAKSETAKKVLAKKLERLVNDLKKAKPSLTTLPKARKTVKSLNTKAFEELVEKLSKNPEYSFLKNYSQERLLRDKARTAKPKGYRFKGDNDKKPTPAQVKKGLKDGSVYYEGRPIHSDISRDIRLKRGGNAGLNNDSKFEAYKEMLIKTSDSFEKGEGFNSRYLGATNKKGDKTNGEYVIEGQEIIWTYTDKNGKDYTSSEQPELRLTFADGGNIYSDMTEKEFLTKYFGANTFVGNPSEYFDIKNLSSGNDSKVEAFIADLKKEGYSIKKKSYSDFTSVMGVKKKNKMATGGAVSTETIDLKFYNVWGQVVESGKVIIDYDNETITLSSGKTYKVEPNREYTYKFLKTKIKAVNGIKGLAEYLKEISVSDHPSNTRVLTFIDSDESKMADGGNLEKGYNNPEKSTHVLHIDGGNWYLEKIDSTHFYMSNNPNSRGMAHHVDQHRGEPYYEEVRSWLKSTKFAEGGRIDLFEDYENIPPNVQKILDKYAEEFGEDFGSMDYSDMADMHKEIVAVGYTFESGLDNMPYGLRPVGVKLNELRDYEDEPDDEMAKGGGIDIKNRQTVVAYKNDLRASYVIDKKNRGFKITRLTGSVLMPFGTDYTDDWRKWFKNNTDNFEILMATGGTIDNSYLGTTLIRKGHYGWMAKTTTKKQIKGYDWEITTMKRSSGDLVSTATGGKSEDKGSYSTFMYSPFEDPSYRLVSSKPKMVNEKAVTKQHEEALKIFIEKLNEMKSDKMATGGKVDGKTYNVMHNVGKSKYVVNFHDGVKKHSDGSRFFDIEIFKNLKELKAFTKKLDSEGYKKQMKHGGSLKVNEDSYIMIYAQVLSYQTGLQADAIRDFAYENHLSDDELLNILQGIGTKKLSVNDLISAVVGKKGNKKIAEVVEFAKSDKAFSKMATGGSVKASDKKFKEIQDLGSEQYYTRYFGKFETEKGEIELMVVATIRDLEDYVSEDELPKEGNFQLSFDIVPKEEFISEDLLEQANDEDSSVGDDSLVNIVNYMGGLRYEPSEKVHFKTQEKALKHLMSIPLNKEINRNGEYPDNIIYSNYNRAGSTNEMYLDYMIGASDKFFKSGGNVGKSKKNKYLYIPNQDISKIVLKSKQVIGKNRILDGAYVKGGKQQAKFTDKYKFPIGSVVWDKTHKRYGVVLNNYGDEVFGDHDEIRLDSDGNQNIHTYDKKWNNNGYNLVPYGSEDDKGNGDLTDNKESAVRIIELYANDENLSDNKKYYEDAYKDLLSGKIDGKPHKTSSVNVIGKTSTGKSIYQKYNSIPDLSYKELKEASDIHSKFAKKAKTEDEKETALKYSREFMRMANEEKFAKGLGKFATGGNIESEVEELWRGYATAILFAEMDYETDELLDYNYSISDFDEETEKESKELLRKFYTENKKAIEESGLDLDTIGNDIWYTRAGHGAGFFDHSLDSDVEEALTKGAKALGEHPDVETYDGKISVRGGRVFQYKKGGKITKEDALQEAIDMGVDFNKDFHAQSFGNELSELAKKVGYRKSPSSSGSTGRAFFYHLQKIYDKKKFATGGSVSKYIDGMTEAEIIKATVVYDNGGETLDRYTVFTPDGSVYGMSETGGGFNQYVGDDSEVEKGSHLGKLLKSVPKGIKSAVLDRMKEEFADGGMMYGTGGSANNSVDEFKVGDSVEFSVPYFESKFDYKGKIIDLKNNYAVVEYYEPLNDLTLKTHIDLSRIKKYAKGGNTKEDYSGNYYSSTDFVETHDLIDLAKETFGDDWESGGDYDYDTEEIKMLLKELGGGYRIVYVDSENRDEFEEAKQKYFPLLKNRSNDGDIFVIPRKPKMGRGGNTNYSYIERDKIDRIVTNSGKEYGSNVILDGAYVTDRVRTPKMSRTQFEDETFEYARGGGVEYQNIKKEKQKMTTELFEKCGVFFAFSDKQFDENKTPLKEGEKYVSIGGGGYMPKGSIKAFEEGMKAINSYGKQKVKKSNLQETEILYELQNHECFYTGDISDVVDLFEGTYTVKQIRDVYNKYREENQDYAKGGEITAEEREKGLKKYPKFNF
jgi:hypothetical protein